MVSCIKGLDKSYMLVMYFFLRDLLAVLPAWKNQSATNYAVKPFSLAFYRQQTGKITVRDLEVKHKSDTLSILVLDYKVK